MSKTLPDFIGIGAMKSGTTTLYYLLDQQPEISMSSTKETDLFGPNWDRGLDWYGRMFAGARPGQLVGEISPSYMGPVWRAHAATRMAELIPDVSLFAVLRDPVARMRSHYRHEVFRGFEKRPFEEAVSIDSMYLEFSLYFQCLRPYLDAFPRDNILIVTFEEVFSNESSGWSRILNHLGLSDRPRPEGSWEVSATKAPVAEVRRRVMAEKIAPAVERLPKSLKTGGRRVLQWSPRAKASRSLIAKAEEGEIPDDVMAALREDQEELAASVGPVAHLVR
jgi:hypothetical protein